MLTIVNLPAFSVKTLKYQFAKSSNYLTRILHYAVYVHNFDPRQLKTVEPILYPYPVTSQSTACMGRLVNTPVINYEYSKGSDTIRNHVDGFRNLHESCQES